jgi:hypothetical protein
MVQDYDIRKHSVVHTEAHCTSDTHEPEFLLASLLCMFWQPNSLYCCCGWYWRREVPSRCHKQFPGDECRTTFVRLSFHFCSLRYSEITNVRGCKFFSVSNMLAMRSLWYKVVIFVIVIWQRKNICNILIIEIEVHNIQITNKMHFDI